MSNPAWPRYSKIGSAIRLKPRLLGYQTGSPLRDYRLDWAWFVRDRLAVEFDIHETLGSLRASGEWFQIDAESAIQLIKFYLEKDQTHVR